MSDEELFKKITEDMYELFKRKNTDYGNSAHKTYEEFGLISFLVRLSDKLNRAVTLNKQDAMVQDEKIEDTLMDMANYSILALIEMKKERTCTENDPLAKVTDSFRNVSNYH